jgi:NADH-quinone oxidoreductase subunit J
VPVGFLFLLCSRYPISLVLHKVQRMLTIGYLVLAIAVLAGAVVAVLAENMIRAAVALGLGSVSLAGLLFILDAPHAGGFELSVGAGLISILFILAISLTESMGGRPGGS